MIDPRLRLREALADGVPSPDAFTDFSSEYQALQSGAGLFVRSDRRVWRVSGADAIDYLHRMLTQHIAGLPESGAARACLLNRNGKVLGDFTVWREGAACVLDAQPAAADHALPVLEKFVIADDVTFDEISETSVRFVLAGPLAREVIEASGLTPPALGACLVAPMDGEELRIAGVSHGDGERFECLAPRSHAAAMTEGWISDERVVPIGNEAFEAERIRICEPAQPQELHDDMLFNEAQLESAVSWTKGCYPGQEPVVMAKHRGRPPRLLVGLRGAGPAPDAGMPLARDGKTVGVLTSLAPTPEGWIGLAFVRTALAESGGALDGPQGPAQIRS